MGTTKKSWSTKNLQRVFGPWLLGSAMALLVSNQAWATANYVYHGPGVSGPGCASGGYRQPESPGDGEGVTLYIKVEYAGYTNQARVYYSTQGSTPHGSFGTAGQGSQVAVATLACSPNDNGDVDVYSVTLPAQSPGTLLSYVISAWHDGGGDEIFANSGTCEGCGNCTSADCATLFHIQYPEATDAGIGQDAGLVDAAETLDSSLGGDAQSTADAGLVNDAAGADDAQTDDAQSGDASFADVGFGDGTQPDNGAFDAQAQDHNIADSAGADSMAGDSAIIDGGSVADAALDDAAQTRIDAASADASGVDVVSSADASICTPGCRDPYYRVVCGADNEALVLACPSGSLCADGSCVTQGDDSEQPPSESGGCGCAQQNPSWPPLLAFVLLGLWWRRRPSVKVLARPCSRGPCGPRPTKAN